MSGERAVLREALMPLLGWYIWICRFNSVSSSWCGRAAVRGQHASPCLLGSDEEEREVERSRLLGCLGGAGRVGCAERMKWCMHVNICIYVKICPTCDRRCCILGLGLIFIGLIVIDETSDEYDCAYALTSPTLGRRGNTSRRGDLCRQASG